MFLLAVIVLAVAGLIVVGYRDVSTALSPQAARGLLTMMLGLGAAAWLLTNITW